MSVDRRQKNVGWHVTQPDGSMSVSHCHASLAVLMDIRDELQVLNRLLGCRNCIDIPKILRAIQKNTTKRKRAK